MSSKTGLKIIDIVTIITQKKIIKKNKILSEKYNFLSF